MKNEIDLVPEECDPDVTQIVELRKKSDEIKKELEKLAVQEKKEQHQDIVKCYEEAIECELNDAKFFKLLGELIADHFNDKERAIEYFEKAISCENLSDEDATGMGFTLMNFGASNKASKFMQKAIELNSNNAQALNMMAITLMQIGEKEQAVSFMRKAAELDPDDIDIQTNYQILLKIIPGHSLETNELLD